MSLPGLFFRLDTARTMSLSVLTTRSSAFSHFGFSSIFETMTLCALVAHLAYAISPLANPDSRASALSQYPSRSSAIMRPRKSVSDFLIKAGTALSKRPGAIVVHANPLSATYASSDMCMNRISFLIPDSNTEEVPGDQGRHAGFVNDVNTCSRHVPLMRK